MTMLVPTLPNDEARSPSLDDAGRRALRALREHSDAPRWTYALGDRLTAADLAAVDRLRARLAAAPPAPAQPSADLMEHLQDRARHTPALRARLGNAPLAEIFDALPATRRADLAARPWAFVPDDIALDRLIIYRTAGTTGHPVVVPHHPLAIAAYLPLIERALAAHGVAFQPRPGEVAAFLVSHQQRTYTYATALAAWANAGFAKLNLAAADWPDAGAPARYLAAFDPPLLHGDALTFATLLRAPPAVRPRWLLSTSVELAPGLRTALAAAFPTAVVVDWYACVEAGPIAVSAPDGLGMMLIADDLLVECLGRDHRPLPIPAVAAADGEPTELGTIVVSGGRNPFLPLLRYDTGDRGRLVRAPDGTLRLVGLQGRAALQFRAGDGTWFGSVDVSRALREHPAGARLAAHRFAQAADGACALTLRPLPGGTWGAAEQASVAEAIAGLTRGAPLRVTREDGLFDAELRAGRKPVAYASAVDEAAPPRRPR